MPLIPDAADYPYNRTGLYAESHGIVANVRKTQDIREIVWMTYRAEFLG
jgi:hypothetical protein